MSGEEFQTADEKAGKERVRTAKKRAQEELEDLQALLKDYRARAFIWRFLGMCEVFGNASNEPFEMARFLGRRDVGLGLMEEIFTADENAYNIMSVEAENRKRR